ncbi:MAG: PEP-CTERM sorting domain-containing protein [Terriglobia bacterium]
MQAIFTPTRLSKSRRRPAAPQDMTRRPGKDPPGFKSYPDGKAIPTYDAGRARSRQAPQLHKEMKHMNNKWWMNFVLCCAVLVFGCACAFGDNISLSQDPDAGFTFFSTSPASSTVDIGLFGNISSSAVLTTNNGPVLGTYTIAATAAATPLIMTLAHPPLVNPNLWWISGGPLSFGYSDGTNTLTGDLRLVDLAQAPGNGMTANLNDALAVNLTHLGGNLAADFGPGAVVNITLDFPSSERLACLLDLPPSTAYPACPASGPSSITADFDHGTVDAAPTPEPASLSLFGIGLLGLALSFRRRLKAVVR